MIEQVIIEKTLSTQIAAKLVKMAEEHDIPYYVVKLLYFIHRENLKETEEDIEHFEVINWSKVIY